MTEVELYYDIACPYAYLASTQIEGVCARHDAALVWRPVLLGGLFQANDTPQVPVSAMPPAKARHQALDTQRWARFRGVELHFPRAHPMRTVDALRLILVAPEAAWARLTHALYRAYWIEGRRVDDRAVLAEVADEVGLDGAGLTARLGDPEVKQALRDRTDAAIARGVFGVPTFFVGDQMFWGQDRLSFVDEVLAGREVPGVDDLPSYNLYAPPLPGAAAEGRADG